MATTELADTILVPASHEQWVQSVRNTAEGWGLPLTPDQHLEKELMLEKLDLCAGGKFKGWVLVPKHDPDTLDFLSSCETFLRPVAVSVSGGPCQTHPSYSIASVWCPPKFRRKGYAARMATLLHAKLANPAWLKAHAIDDAPTATNTALMSVLYSDVGEFYSRAKPPGWHIRGRDQTVWTLRSAGDLPPPFPSSVAPVSTSDLVPLATADATLLRSELERRSAEGQGRICFAVVPNGHDVSWLAARSRYLSSHLPKKTDLGGGLREQPTVFGAKASDGSWATLFLDFANDVLYFTRVRCEDPATFKELLQAAKSVAHTQGLPKITAWALDPELVRGTGGRTSPRDNSLPAVAWYGGSPFHGVEVDDEASGVDWLANEKYAWC